MALCNGETWLRELDSLNAYNATSPAGDIVWVRYPEHIQWPLEKRERGERRTKVGSKAVDIIWVR